MIKIDNLAERVLLSILRLRISSSLALFPVTPSILLDPNPLAVHVDETAFFFLDWFEFDGLDERALTFAEVFLCVLSLLSEEEKYPSSSSSGMANAQVESWETGKIGLCVLGGFDAL